MSKPATPSTTTPARDLSVSPSLAHRERGPRGEGTPAALVPARDPRRALVRLLARLEGRAALVTLADLERAAERRPTRSLPTASIAPLLEAALADMLIVTDRRFFLDRATRTLTAESVYRVNRRHPLARETLA